ncbi:MAG: hypothetical protein D6736_01060 [Nitrospinota bacterium]|nr:MAG: hypothetical protein D6736_01060 [Nitrospinota bacterium]
MWRALFEAAIRFRDTAPWQWMYDSDLFGVQNPYTREIGYCCVMGNLGQMFALAVYLGSEGLQSYLKIATGEASYRRDPVEVLTTQKCLVASFEDRAELSREDRDLIKRLGLKIRGRKAWPLFRSYQPGYHPWYLSAEEVRFLPLPLNQALEVALRFRDDPALFIPPQEQSKEAVFLVRVPQKKRNRWVWEDAWLSPAPLPTPQRVIPSLDELWLNRLKKQCRQGQTAWELDYFFLPNPVQEEKKRPYYPYALLCIDHRSGFIMATEILPPWALEEKLAPTFLDLVERSSLLPRELLVQRQEVKELLAPVASRLGVSIKMVQSLKTLNAARKHLLAFLG